MNELGFLSCGSLGSAFQLLAGQLAYIDPATGSMVFQMLVAGFLGALMAFRRFRDRIVGALSGRLGRRRGRSPESGRAPDPPAAEPDSDVSAERP